MSGSAEGGEGSPSSAACGTVGSEASVELWWRIADLGVFGVWLSVVAWILPYHEKWADEAQAWLIARDLPLGRIWFYELRYEGAPPLWHTLLWVAQHFFHLPYGALGYIGMAGAAAGVALLIFKAPFPRWIRWPLAFTYVMVYQYAVIARPYTLLPLLVFAVALCFNDLQRPVRMTVVLVLLALLSLHGTILAAGFGLGYLLDALPVWSVFDARLRRRYLMCVAAMAVAFALVVVVCKPTPDVSEFADKKELAAQASQMTPEQQAKLPTKFTKLNAAVCGGFLDYSIPSFLFLGLMGAWFFVRRRFLLFAFPVAGLLVLYVFIHGYPHHHGAAYVALLGALWIAWPKAAEMQGASAALRQQMYGISFLLLCLCAVNLWDAKVTLERERLYPYSGADDAARFLKSVGADRQPMFGYLFGVTAVQAYFDRPIFANIPTTYFHHGLPRHGINLDEDLLVKVAPEYIVAFSTDPQLMAESGVPMLERHGYRVVHLSDGYYLYKQAVHEREFYFILQRMGPGPVQ